MNTSPCLWFSSVFSAMEPLALPNQHGQTIGQRLESLDDSKRTAISLLDMHGGCGTRDFVGVIVPTHRQVYVPRSLIRVDTCSCLGCFYQQAAQQGVALLADVSQPLLAGAGVFTRNHAHVRTDLLAARKPRRSSDD